MTEEEWLNCKDATVMTQFIRYENSTVRPLVEREFYLVGSRKLRLFACACARHVWGLIDSAGSRFAVEVAEMFADGGATLDELREAYGGASAAAVSHADAAAKASASCNERIAGTTSPVGHALYAALYAAWDRRREQAGPALADLLRDIAGNLLREQTFRMPPCCEVRSDLWGLASVIAHEVYAGRDPATGHLDHVRLAVLADVLCDAGCDDDRLLTHLRSPGPHVRGCWAVDLITGRK